MAKVIKPFKERFQDFKLYTVGETYDYKDQERVSYLVKSGFLELDASEDPKPRQSKKRSVSKVDTDA